MTRKNTSPTVLRSLDDQLRDLYARREATDRLLQALEEYQKLMPVQASGDRHAA